MRSDKDCEPETYGEGIEKKEIQYRRTLCLKTIISWGARRSGVSLKTSTFNGRILTQRTASEFVEEECGHWLVLRWTVCRLGYSEGAAMAVGSLSLHIGIWRGTACVPNRQENATFICDPSEPTILHLCETDSASRQKSQLFFLNRGATGRGQIHDYFSRRRVFKGPLKEILEYKEEMMLWLTVGGKERAVY